MYNFFNGKFWTLKKIAIILLFIIILILIISQGIIKLRNCEKEQNRIIWELYGRADYLEEKLAQTSEYYNYTTEYSDNSYNYLAIGNSLTIVKSWGNGACSTQPYNDYFNLVSKYLTEKYNKVVAYSINFASWERSPDRDKTLNILDVYLSDKLNLITIQLGENVSQNSKNYKEDLEKLVDYVHKKAPRAEILIIGDFWNFHRNDIRKDVAKNKKCIFVDISPTIGNKKYQSEIGKICYLKNGQTIEVTKQMATHPGDQGMQYIANAIIKNLK